MNDGNTKTDVATLGRLDTRAISDLAATKGHGSMATFMPNDFGGVMQMANLMATSGAAVPKHLRQNPGMCLSVAMVAYQNGFNPFLLSADTFVVNDVLSYGSKSIAAMVDNSPQLAEPLNVTLEGKWPDRVAHVIGRFKNVSEPRVVTIYASPIQTRNSPLWKQQPDLQLMYYARRAWARQWLPGVLLGMLGDDEAAEMTDITPAAPPVTLAEVKGAQTPHDPQTGEIIDSGQPTRLSALAEEGEALVPEGLDALAKWFAGLSKTDKSLIKPELDGMKARAAQTATQEPESSRAPTPTRTPTPTQTPAPTTRAPAKTEASDQLFPE